jgi:hypothetical protein
MSDEELKKHLTDLGVVKCILHSYRFGEKTLCCIMCYYYCKHQCETCCNLSEKDLEERLP